MLVGLADRTGSSDILLALGSGVGRLEGTGGGGISG